MPTNDFVTKCLGIIYLKVGGVGRESINEIFFSSVHRIKMPEPGELGPFDYIIQKWEDFL